MAQKYSEIIIREKQFCLFVLHEWITTLLIKLGFVHKLCLYKTKLNLLLHMFKCNNPAFATTKHLLLCSALTSHIMIFILCLCPTWCKLV